MSEESIYKVVLEGPTEESKDDIVYSFLPIESLTGNSERPIISAELLTQLKEFCSSGGGTNYICYDDIKQVEANGEVVPHDDSVLLNSVSLFGEPFAALLKQVGEEWEVVAVEAGQFTSSGDFIDLSGEEKTQRILAKIQSFLDDPESYSNIHVINPYTIGRVYPF